MGKITVQIVLEILGRPQEHVLDALNDLVKRLGGEKGIKIIEQTIHPPILAKDSKDLYTSFAELTMEIDSLSLYFGLLFAYMPAHTEILSPSNFELTNLEMSQLGAKLIHRLHDYDAITKKMIFENEFLSKKLYEVAPHLFKQAPPGVAAAQKSQQSLESMSSTEPAQEPVKEDKKKSKKK